MSLVPLGRVVELVTEKADAEDFSIGLEAIESATGRLVPEPVTDYAGTGTAFRAGDLLFGKLRPYLAKAWLADRNGAAVGDFHVYRPGPQASPEYLRWVLLARNFLDPVESSVFGSKMPRANWEFIRQVPIRLPSLDEQQAIARYLDAETAKIDTLIAEQQALTGMLRDRRDVVVDLVLAEHGFRPPSTLDSLTQRDLPEGWRLVLLGPALRQLTNGFVGPTRDILVDEGVRYIQSTHIKSGRIDFARRPFYVRQDWHDARPRVHLGEGDVLIVQTGDIGKVAVVPKGFGEASCHALQIARVRPEIMSGEYLGRFLTSRLGYHSLRSRATGALHPHLEAGIRGVQVVVPPADLQAQIVAESDSQTAKIDTLMAETERFIELARERRAALITAAVMGQIDVREAS